MTSKTDTLDAVHGSDPYAVNHHGVIATRYADASPNAADARARGAADRMWQKVEEDLAQIDRAPTDDADDD